MRPLKRPVVAARDVAALTARSAGNAISRLVQRVARVGEHGRAVDVAGERPTVLLFYEDFERDRLLRGDRYLRRAIRRVYHAATLGQSVSGFEIAFRALCTALERAGCRVVVNNPALARRHPEHPVGVCGYTHVLDRWSLPNPVVLGPGLFDDPAHAPRLFDDPRLRVYLVPCEWMREFFAEVYGDVCRLWFAGIDVDLWPDFGGLEKDIDVLVYDKIRWWRDTVVPAVMDPALAELERRGLRYHVIRYRKYTTDEYRALLARSRGMLFLCEHETQGLAYQEALACNVPVLAWDEGGWLPPERKASGAAPYPASSVPYFSAECGERFAGAADFAPALDRFVARLGEYSPRRFVARCLSFERSAELYLAAYAEAGRGARDRAPDAHATARALA